MIKIRNIGLITFLVFLSVAGIAQHRYKVEEGTCSFTSDAPLELIQGYTQKLNGVIDAESGKLAFVVKIMSFEGFKSNLQRDHFHENYMETNKYPKATFSGKFIESVDFGKQGVQQVKVRGDLTLHGKTRSRMIEGTINIQEGKMYIKSTFPIALADYNISVPKIMFQKLASEVNIDLSLVMSSVE